MKTQFNPISDRAQDEMAQWWRWELCNCRRGSLRDTTLTIKVFGDREVRWSPNGSANPLLHHLRGSDSRKLWILFLIWWSIWEKRESIDLNWFVCRRWLRSYQIQYIVACQPRRVSGRVAVGGGREIIWLRELSHRRSGRNLHLYETRFHNSNAKSHSEYRWSRDSSVVLHRRHSEGTWRPPAD